MGMGAAGSDIAIETGHIALMGEEWSLIPELGNSLRLPNAGTRV